MNRTFAALIGSVALVIGLLAILVKSDSPRVSPLPNAPKNSSIVMFCAASNRAVIEAIREEYEQEFGRRVQIQYGPSQTLLSSIEVSGSGDLYLPADESFIDIAKDKSLVKEVIPVAQMTPGLAVRKGNPKSIHTFEDLLRDDVQLVQASTEAAAIGVLTKRVMSERGVWPQLDQATTAYRLTVSDVANDLVAGAADVGIVYDAVLHTYPDLEFVPLEEFGDRASSVSLGVVTHSLRPQAALHFARYVAARDRGQRHYEQNGFKTTPGDVWNDLPELSLFAGSMLRPAIEETIVEFERREGARVSRVYNGCGILVAQMKAGQHPDVYIACDTEFMNQVPDLFPEPIDVSQNELVILVKKGNPHAIATLRDLARPGLRVGIGHEKQCAMGWLTQNTFREGGVQSEVMANVTVQTPTGDMLVNQLLTGSLDAAVVYLSNAAGAGDSLDAVRIQGLECSVATQPFAISPQSPHAQLASRLFEAIADTDSEETFRAEGFRWQLGAKSSN